MTSTELKDRAYAELVEKAHIQFEGIRITDETLEKTGAGVSVKEAGRIRDPGEKLIPGSFTAPMGLQVSVRNADDSDYALEYADGKFLITKEGHLLFDDIQFEPRPKYYDRQTSDGKPMQDIVSIVTNGCAAVWYSNECAYKEQNEDCMFCDINAGPGNIFLKTPAQIAESVKAAYDEGVGWRIDFTGGVIPERKEIDYYTDAIEAIQDALGTADLIAAACIAAPRSFESITRLKEAGFSIITMNIEMWDENFFKTVCPGKARTVGYEQWKRSLEFGAKTFGFGQVRCNFVTGIEPKHKTLEGIEYLASIGVVGNPNIFSPRPGTPLEGHRCPTVEWNLDLQEKASDILRRSGITFEQVTNCHPVTTGFFHDFWRIKEERLPAFSQISESETPANPRIP
jgi:hypothetical protein